MSKPFRQSVLNSPSLLAVALQDVFSRRSLSFACLFYASPPILLAHNQAASDSAEVKELAQRCAKLIHENKHPALAVSQRLLSPIDMLSPSLDLGEDKDVLALRDMVRKENFKTYYCIPLRDVDGDLIIAAVLSRTKKFSSNEMKILQADCYDALVLLESEFKEDVSTQTNLSERERECLICAARGLTERETAAELKISPHTVHAHIENAKRRLKAPNKLVTVIKSIKSGEIKGHEITFD